MTPTPAQQEAIHNWAKAVNELDAKTANALEFFTAFEHEAGLTEIADLERYTGQLRIMTARLRLAFSPPPEPEAKAA